ncbi:hypothetical protein RJ641_001929 [Dillenia turbinata]|uniref:tRNA wybutosine-synthesizing protein 3 n=1 Tax=Dillenia turbinata TaxID=194707 RepID=A0AAN8VDH5_9MAGN
MEFEKRKSETLASMESLSPDKSPKGTIDTPIIPLLKTLNSHSDFFTTSSCSGRISILSTPLTTSTAKPNKKARGGSWLYITHELANPNSVVNLLFNNKSSPSDQNSELVFRFEPFILAVECRDVDSADNLVRIAISSGFRESGITGVGRRVIVGIRSSIRMEVPLGMEGGVMVTEEYVRFLVSIANGKMEENWRRSEGFLRALKKKCFVGLGNDGVFCEEFERNGVVGAEDEYLEFKRTSGSGGNNGNFEAQEADGVASSGSLGVSICTLSMYPMDIEGEPLEKLFLWGHTTCTLTDTLGGKILVFGGFGGSGRHARRNDCLLFNPFFGSLKTIDVGGTPSPRMGHTSSMVGDCMFVIGGRTDPTTILNEVWVLNTSKNEWRLLECTGGFFPPRHRHAAAVVDSSIYVFGGINDDMIYSSFHVLNTDSLQWDLIQPNGELPCARHSHSMVVYGSQVFLFGGHNGEKALGDLYSYDVKKCLWKKETMTGKAPYPRFSHLMFVYKNYLGILGGCPITQHYQELALLDLRFRVWQYVGLNSVGKDLFVRSTANVVGDDLIVIGGGSSCYAFGTSFSEPTRINMSHLPLKDDILLSSEVKGNLANHEDDGVAIEMNGDSKGPQNGVGEILDEFTDLLRGMEIPDVEVTEHQVASNWVAEVEPKHAKSVKDILKKFGWLDLGKKVHTRQDGACICFPVTEKFCAVFHSKQGELGDCNDPAVGPWAGEKVSLNEMSCSMAMDFLMACGVTKCATEVVKVRKAPNSPLKSLHVAVASMIQHHGLSEELLKELPTRWERLGDIVVLPVASFKDPIWDTISKELWPVVAESLDASRLARQGRIAPNGTRDSTLEILVGDNGWVNHRENGIIYAFDATKCMFSWGNLSEKLRMGSLDCKDEVIVDLFAGIGYFVLPFLVRAKAKLVYACEWNPHAIDALRHNVHANSVGNRCIILEGDNRLTTPVGIADRVCLGLLPSSEGSWVTAVRALRREGGVLHVHGNVKDSEEGLWPEHVSKSIFEIARSEGHSWKVSVEHVERVKWYAPHIRHLVADVRCKVNLG